MDKRHHTPIPANEVGYKLASKRSRREAEEVGREGTIGDGTSSIKCQEISSNSAKKVNIRNPNFLAGILARVEGKAAGI